MVTPMVANSAKMMEMLFRSQGPQLKKIATENGHFVVVTTKWMLLSATYLYSRCLFVVYQMAILNRLLKQTFSCHQPT